VGVWNRRRATGHAGARLEVRQAFAGDPRTRLGVVITRPGVGFTTVALQSPTSPNSLARQRKARGLRRWVDLAEREGVFIGGSLRRRVIGAITAGRRRYVSAPSGNV
jgi:hypothetical protein